MLNDNLPIALYQQLVREFTAKIRNNAWPVGCMLPGEMQLCREYNVSRSTVRQAMDVLVRNGLVTRKQGRGTFVAMPKLEQNLVKFYSFSEEIKRMGYTPSSSIVSFRKLPADANMAARLSIEPNSEIFSLRRLRLADGKPFALETSYIPAALYPFMTEEMIREKGLYQTMRQNSSFQPDTAVETFQAILISKADAKLLNVDRPAPGLFDCGIACLILLYITATAFCCASSLLSHFPLTPSSGLAKGKFNIKNRKNASTKGFVMPQTCLAVYPLVL